MDELWRMLGLSSIEPTSHSAGYYGAALDMQRHYNTLALSDAALRWEMRRQERVRRELTVRLRLSDHFGIPWCRIRFGLEETVGPFAWLYRLWARLGVRRETPPLDG